MSAIRSVFLSKPTYPFFEEIRVSMDLFGGFALSQKRKTERSLHRNFLAAYPESHPLEISSASLNPVGRALSAMHLTKTTSSGKLTSVESAFQSSRIYRDGSEQIGPFPEYLYADGREAKKEVKAASRGLHSYEYMFDGIHFGAPDFHISMFYDFLYLNALTEKDNTETTRRLLEGGFDAFSDLATSSLNSQARSCAIFVGLVKAGRIEEVKTVFSFNRLFRVSPDGQAMGRESYENVQLLDSKGNITLLSPVVLLVVGREEILYEYDRFYGHLSNKKHDDGFIRPSVMEAVDILKEDINRTQIFKMMYRDNAIGYRISGAAGCINIPPVLFPGRERKDIETIQMTKYDNTFLSKNEIDAHVMWPWLNETHKDVLPFFEHLIGPFPHAT